MRDEISVCGASAIYHTHTSIASIMPRDKTLRERRTKEPNAALYVGYAEVG